MKKGDYMIHVFLEQARSIKCPDGATVDPIFEISVMNEKKFSVGKEKVTGKKPEVWSEHLFFEPRGVSVDQIEQAKIEVRLLDKGYFKDAMIGQYEFDVAYVYFMKEHTMHHQWVAMQNPSGTDFNEVAAYLKLSINVIATGDEQVQLTEDTSPSDDSKILMPPCIKPTFYQIYFRFFKAEKLPIMDKNLIGKGGSIDAYLICKTMNTKLKTKVYTMKDEQVFWYQEFRVPCQLPIMSSRIIMKLYDEDKLSDELVGSFSFSLKDVIEKTNGKFFWKNIYGAPLDVSGENTKLMNNNPETASTWKGRILMQTFAEKTEKPQLACEEIPEEVRDQAFAFTQQREYEVMAEFGQGVALPDKKKYSIELTIGDLSIKSGPPAYAENTYNRWNFRTPATKMIAPYPDINDIGRVYFYLVDEKGKRVCFASKTVKDFQDPNPSFQWVTMTNDLAIGKVKDAHKAGTISIKMAIHDVSKNGPIDFSKFAAWKKPPPKRLSIQKVRAYIFQCRDLPAADSDGQSDPYITIWDTSKTLQQTAYIEDNCNPMFYTCMELYFEANSIESMPPFVIDIWDKDDDLTDSTDDYISRALIPVSESSYSTDDKVPRPVWHQCKLSPTSPPQGEILISFSIVADDYTFATPLQYKKLTEEVNFRNFKIEINILGLRNLQSSGLLPVKKGFIVFNLKSLIPPDNKQALENIKTQPGPAGANPTINTTIDFNMNLPDDPLFCPKLQCQVYDNILTGFHQPLIGVFTIPIGEILFERRDNRTKELEQLDYIVDQIQKISRQEAPASYSIQGQSFSEDINFRESQAKFKNSVAKGLSGADKMAKPLIQQIEEEGKGEHSLQQMRKGSDRTPSKKTPKQLMAHLNPKSPSAGGGANIMKSPTIKKFDANLKEQLLKEHSLELDKIKRENQQDRERAEAEFSRCSHSANKNVIKAKYIKNERLNVMVEHEQPPESVFLGLGFDDDHSGDPTKRHYRRYYTDELENIKDVMPVASPFDQYEIKKGQTRGASSGLFSFSFGKKKEDDSGSLSTEAIMGKFKGLIMVATETEQDEYKEEHMDKVHKLKIALNSLSLKKTQQPIDSTNLEKLETAEGRHKFDHQMDKLGVGHLKISKYLAESDYYSNLKQLLMGQTQCIIRLYMISAYDLASRDNGGESDPYLVIKLGDKAYNDRANYQEDEPNPVWCKQFEFQAEFPGCPQLQIQVFDEDDLFGDDIIGETFIDLEDRFFLPQWQQIKQKPIEYRQIYHSSTSISQGVLKCWVEIWPQSIDQKDVPIYEIAPKEPQTFEVRLVVFDTVDIIAMDVEGTSDVFVRAFFDSKKDKETDTHFRCMDGKASFNYRILFDYVYPPKKTSQVLQIQVYDRDLLKANDLIGETQLDLSFIFEDVQLIERQMSITKEYWDVYLKDKMKDVKGLKWQDDSTFWVEVWGDDNGKYKCNGKVRLGLDVLPKEKAVSNRVGGAREEPNHSPFLPPPVGRISLTLDPIKMFNQMVGPALRRKIYMACCLAVCIALCIFMAPMILSNLISKLILG